MTPRTRGGQPKNLNALKHGFYARTFSRLELEDLDAISANIQDELTLLRVATRRLAEYANTTETDIDTAIAILNAHGNATIRIASLMRTQRLLASENTAGSALSQALADVIKEFGLT